MSELGTWLIRAREARGLTLEDAERDTRISRRYLQALESEQFEVIPAPVYARGFLRSYSQYLGLDPAEMLALFPREDRQADGQPVIGAQRANASSAAGPPRATRPQRQQPPSAVGPARPAWRRPDSDEPAPSPLAPSSRPSVRGPGPAARPGYSSREPELPLEPMIGVDIGVPAPARRIKTDPAAQTRSVVIAVVAVAVVVAVVLVAYLLSSLGGGSPGAGPTPATNGSLAGPAEATAAAAAATAQGASPAASPSAAASHPAAATGIVPNVIGMTAAQARAALTAAGFKVNELPQTNNATKGTVFSQAPAPNVQFSPGLTVTIATSTGP